MPRFSVTEKVFEPPWKVGLAPTTAPEDEAMVTLCASEAALAKAIETVPALALSEVVLYFSWPSGSAERLSVPPAPAVPVAGAGAGVEEVAGAGALVDVEAEELVVLELPHPVSARRPAAIASIEAIGSERALE